MSMEYYQKIRNIREDMDYKQYEFAELIHVLPKTYSSYEKGTRSISYPVLSRILKKLNLSLDYILELSDQRVYPNLQKIDINVIPKNFKYYRNKMNLSQKEMADLLNCRQQTLSSYEKGYIKIPIDVLKRFCEVTHISADTITGRTESERILKKRIDSKLTM